MKCFKDCLFNNKSNTTNNMLIFRSNLHKLCTQKITKVALSSQDDQRKIRDDCIHTYAWGHYKIVN